MSERDALESLHSVYFDLCEQVEDESEEAALIMTHFPGKSELDAYLHGSLQSAHATRQYIISLFSGMLMDMDDEMEDEDHEL